GAPPLRAHHGHRGQGRGHSRLPREAEAPVQGEIVAVERVGVVGAGTMGAGIAQISSLGGYRTVIYEIDSKGLERGLEQLTNGLGRGVERGRWSEQQANEALTRIETDSIIEVLRGCELVIEAAPEDLNLKRNLFGRLASVCGDETVLATNTSSLSV